MTNEAEELPAAHHSLDAQPAGAATADEVVAVEAPIDIDHEAVDPDHDPEPLAE